MRNHPLALAVLAAACAGSPPRHAADPDIAVPAAFANAPTAAPAAPPLADGFWHAFGDAGLFALVDDVLAHNRDLAAAAARIEAAASSRTIAGAGALPQLDGSLDGSRSKRLFLGFPFGGGGVLSSTTTTFGLALNLRWEIDLWGRLRAGEAAAIADLEARAADYAGARLSLVAQACKAWFAAIEAGRQLALAEATVAAYRRSADDVRDRFRRGVRPALDVHLAELNLANAEATRAQREEQLAQSRRQLELLAGHYPAGTAATADALPSALPAIPSGVPSELLQRRPDLAAAERRLAAAGCRVDAARRALYPKLSLTASGGTSSTELEDLVDGDFSVWSLGANLLQPLFHGGALRADVARGEALARESLATYGGAILRAFAEVEDALAGEQILDRRLQHSTAAAQHARLAAGLARERWELGLADFLAVADGQRQSYQSESNRLLLERLRLDNRIDLFLALGGGFDAGPGRDHGDRP
ncbi:MAG: efflux transporter outer membrane subunit [Planctomycetota bacterium]